MSLLYNNDMNKVSQKYLKKIRIYRVYFLLIYIFIFLLIFYVFMKNLNI